MWKGNIRDILIKKYLKFNILKLLHFQNHTYIWKSWDQIFEFLRLKYYFNYTPIFARILLYHALYVFFDDSSALIYEDTMKIKEDNKVDFFNKVSKYYLRKKKATKIKYYFFFSFLILNVIYNFKTKLISRSSLFIGFNFTYEL